MKSKFLSKKTIISILLASLMTCSLASCSSEEKDTAFLDQISKAEEYSEQEESSEEVSEEITQDGYTAKPIITHMFNIEPYKLVVTGNCEENAIISATNLSTNQVTQTKSIGTYFIMEIALEGNSEHHYEMSALVEGKQESTKNSFSAKFDAVAEKPTDGSAVTIGNNSTLFFDSLIPNYQGTNLLTNSQLNAFKESVANSATNKDVNYVYVMIPSMITVYDEKVPDTITKQSYNTKYQQIVNTLSSIDGVDVLDLTQTFIDNKNGELPIYYNTSSNLSDYGSYLVYQSIMKYITDSDAPADENLSDDVTEESSVTDISEEVSEGVSEETPEIVDFNYLFNSVSGKGGNLTTSLGIENDIFNEKYYYAEKDFTTTFPADSECTCLPSDLVIYADKETNTYYTNAEDDKVFGANEIYSFKTNRENLPSAVFLRDGSANAIIPMLAENFNNAYFGTQSKFSLSDSEVVSAISSYSSSTKNKVDYVFVIISEDNIDELHK
jgi:hypothetical protein